MAFTLLLNKIRFRKCPEGVCYPAYQGLSAQEIQHLFWDSVCDGDVCKARELVACGADVNAFDVDGTSAVCMAQMHGQTQMYEWLDYVRERQAKRLEVQHVQAA